MLPTLPPDFLAQLGLTKCSTHLYFSRALLFSIMTVQTSTPVVGLLFMSELHPPLSMFCINPLNSLEYLLLHIPLSKHVLHTSLWNSQDPGSLLTSSPSLLFFPQLCNLLRQCFQSYPSLSGFKWTMHTHLRWVVHTHRLLSDQSFTMFRSLNFIFAGENPTMW